MIPTNVSCLRAECEGQSAAAPLPRAGDEYATQEAKQTDTADTNLLFKIVTSGRIFTRMVGLTVWGSMSLVSE